MGSSRHRPEVAVRTVTRTARAVVGAAAPALLALVTAASLGRAQGRVEASDTTKANDAALIARSVQSSADSIARSARPVTTYRSRADSVASVRTRIAADRDNDLRVVVSLNERELWALIGPDTLLTAPIA